MKLSVRMITLITLLVTAQVVEATAQENADPTGTWKWTMVLNSQSRDMVLKLKLEGDKLTGAMLGRDNEEIPIRDPKYKDGAISLSVQSPRNDRNLTIKYSGTVRGNTIRGKMVFESKGKEVQSRDWEATREKA